MNSSGFIDQRHLNTTAPCEFLDPGSRAHLTPSGLVHIMMRRSLKECFVSLVRLAAYVCLTNRSKRIEYAVLPTFDPNVDRNAGERWCTSLNAAGQRAATSTPAGRRYDSCPTCRFSVCGAIDTDLAINPRRVLEVVSIPLAQHSLRAKVATRGFS